MNREPGSCLDFEAVIQKHVAGLQVQVQQRFGEVVEEVHAEGDLVGYTEDQGPRWGASKDFNLPGRVCPMSIG